MLPETEIIERLKIQDSSIISYLYDHYGTALYGIIIHIVQDENLAEEVLQETFLKIWQNATVYDAHKGRLYTWMLNIARNLAIDTTRGKSYKKSKKNQSFENNVNHLENKNVHYVPVEEIGIRELVNQLDITYRMIIEKVYFEGYTLADAAEVLEIPLGTLKTRLRTAIQLLRKKV